jgi:nucleoside-diphosphate-sugar epimerase
MVQKVLVTGATGFIGIEVSRQLSERGTRPRLMVRRPVRGLMLRNLEAEIMQADIRSPESLKRILEGMDTVIHLGARAAFEPYPRLYPSIVKGSVNLMQAAIEAGVRNFVFGGSLLVYGDSARPIEQQTEPAPESGYGRVKLEAEQRLAEMAAKADICFVSLRLPHVYGAHSLLFDQVRHGKVFFPGSGDNLFAHIHVYDAARALISAAENGRPGIWVVADDLSCTWNEYFETVKTYYPRLRVAHIPKTISYVSTRFLDLVFGLTAQANPYPSGAISCWNLRLPVVPGTLKQTIGLEPKFSTIHEGIPAVLDDSISFYWLPSNLDRL